MRRLATILGIATAVLALGSSAASALPSTTLASVLSEPTASVTWPDRSVVIRPSPGEPCAAPVFGTPDGHDEGPALAETGVDRALQVSGLLALALAALVGMGRPRVHGATGRDNPG